MAVKSFPALRAFFTSAPKRPIRSSRQWREYFRSNAANLMPIPWDRGMSLTADECAMLSPSVQQFQLGESSDGHHFLYAGRQHVTTSGDTQYLPALRRFIAEEQRHGHDLGRVLDLAGIERIKSAWADTIFRWLRRQAGLELSIGVLVTAEIIAQVYYIALRDATGSIVLRRLCEQILRDEDEHVRFQCERLAILRRRNGRWRVLLKHAAQRIFFAGTSLVFWMKHAPVMRAGGLGFFRFLRALRRQQNIAVGLMDPGGYTFEEHRAMDRANSQPLSAATEQSATRLGSADETPLDLSGKWLEL